MKYTLIQFNKTPRRTWRLLLILLIVVGIQISFFADQFFTFEGYSGEGYSEGGETPGPIVPGPEDPGPENPEPEDPDPEEPPPEVPDPDEEEPEEVEEPEALILATSIHTVGNYADLKTAVQNSPDNDIYITLSADIEMEDYITVPMGKNITIDGGSRDRILDEKTGLRYNFRVKNNTTITFKNMTIYGHHHYAIIEGLEINVHAIFDNVVYRGPELAYIATVGSSCTVRDSEIYIEEYGVTGGVGYAEEAFECPRVFLEGNVLIEHYTGNVNYIITSVFYAVGDADLRFEVRDNARVTINTESYFIYPAGPIALSIGNNATLDIRAAGGIGVGINLAATQHFNYFSLGEGGRFSYVQRESTASVPYTHYKDYNRSLYFKGTFTMEKDSVFIYDTEFASTSTRSTAGIAFENINISLNNPKLFSIYNPAAAFHIIYLGNSPIAWGSSTSWTVNGVNAVNTWTDSANAVYTMDSAVNLPDHVWNYYGTDQDSMISTIGNKFDFTVPSTGVISYNDSKFEDLVGSAGLFGGQAIRSSAIKRFTLGTISDFTVDRILPTDGAITGTFSGQDVAAFYEAEQTSVTLSSATSGSYSMDFGANPLPVSDDDVVVAGNSLGLRALIKTDSLGDLQIISVPELDYGTHKVPAATTTYYREDNATVTNGVMEVMVKDSRGPNATNWRLTVQRDDSAPLPPGHSPLPAAALIFEDVNQSISTVIGTNPSPVFSHVQPPTSTIETTPVTWDRANGILVRIKPGEIDAGIYKTTLVWSVEVTP